MNWNRAGSWMTFAVAAVVGGCVWPGGMDGRLIGRYQQAVAERGAQNRQAVTGIGSLKPAQAYVGSPLAVEDTVVRKVVQIDETYKVVEKYDNATEKVDIVRVVTTTTNEKDPNTGKAAPVVKVDKRGPCSVVYGAAPLDVHQTDTYRVGALSGAAALVAGDHRLVKLSLDQAILRALANSLDIRVVSLDPAIAREDMVKAAAAFDYTLFGATDLIHGENKQNNIAVGSVSKQRDWSLGVKQHTITGADFSLQWAMTRSWDNSQYPKLFNTSYEPTVVLQVTQPLLRNAWPGFNLAQLRIARVNVRASNEAFRQKVEEVITQVVGLYWTLIQARQSMEIQRRLLDQTQDTYGITLSRYQVDATGVVITQLQASVKIREAALITARKNILDVQQALGRLLNDPQLNSLSDCEVVPTTPMLSEKLAMDPVDQMLTALTYNPQLEQARLGIAASEINVTVAKNQTLPKLDLSASAGIEDLAAHADSANRKMLGADYTSYSIGLMMEYPIGNRGALAKLRQSKFERTKAVVTMQNTADQIAVSIQERVRQIDYSHDQIVAQHAAVKASEAELSAIEVTERVRAKLTPEFLQVKLQVQQTLASSQQAELQATVDYNNALADLARLTGTILQQHRVEISMAQVIDARWTPAETTTPTGPAEPAEPATTTVPAEPATTTAPTSTPAAEGGSGR